MFNVSASTNHPNVSITDLIAFPHFIYSSTCSPIVAQYIFNRSYHRNVRLMTLIREIRLLLFYRYGYVFPRSFLPSAIPERYTFLLAVPVGLVTTYETILGIEYSTTLSATVFLSSGNSFTLNIRTENNNIDTNGVLRRFTQTDCI